MLHRDRKMQSMSVNQAQCPQCELPKDVEPESEATTGRCLRYPKIIYLNCGRFVANVRKDNVDIGVRLQWLPGCLLKFGQARHEPTEPRRVDPDALIARPLHH